MKLPNNIKQYPTYFKHLPISNKGFTTLVGKTIYLSKDIISDLKTADPKPMSVAVLLHQQVHAKDASLWKMLKYIFIKDFRIHEEITAYSVMFHYLKEQHQTFDFDHAAKDFSNARYLWMTTLNDGKELLIRIWNNA